MISVRALFALALPAALAGAASAQAAVPFLGNEIQLSDGGSTVWIYNSPSVGGAVGAPTLGADLAYKGVPQNRMRTAAGTAGLSTIEDIFLGDVDWPGGAPDFYDIAIDTSSAEFGVAFDNLVPDFFASGSVAALLSLGNSGFPNPCAASPTSTCSGSLACPPAVSGYIVDVLLGSPLAVPAANDDLAGTHIVNFLPGGMTFSQSGLIGACGLGDYVFMGAQSLTETQADYLTQPGTSWCEGFQLGDPAGISPTGPLEDATSTMLEINFGLVENVVEPEISDSVSAIGPVRGGAGLGIDTSTGGASIAAHITAAPGFAGNLVFPAAALAALPLSGVPVFGANLLIAPDGTFNSTFAAWAGTGVLAPVDEDGDGVNDQAEVVSIALPLPVLTGGRGYMQAFIVTGFGPISAVETTMWAVDFR